jgi:hypothetical protein
MAGTADRLPDDAVARKAIAAASFGNAMEWYDFSVYAFFASYLAQNFSGSTPGAGYPSRHRSSGPAHTPSGAGTATARCAGC